MGAPWLRLLEQYRRDGKFGLTPSFLIGASRTPVGTKSDEKTSLAEFRALLKSMRDGNSKWVRIAGCPTLGQAVAALFKDRGDTSSWGDLVGPGEASRLYAWPQYFEGTARDLDALIACLWGTFGPPICAGNFSYRAGAFCPFDADDLHFIDRALGNDDA